MLALWAFQVFPRGHAARGGALLALGSVLVECAIGAALVLLRVVGSDESLSRGLWLAAHLVNTLFLVAALSATAWQASTIRERGPGYPPLPRRVRQALGLSIVGFLIAGILGTFAALGDTLVVSSTLAASIQADFSASSNIFVRLRILHPIFAGALGVWLLAVAFQVSVPRRVSTVAKRLGGTIAVLVLSQLALGIANIALLTPIWLQLLHLLGADLLWIAFVVLACELLPSVIDDGRRPSEILLHGTVVGS
jgi:heme A synthase